LDHPWLDELDQQKILEKQIEAPVKPELSKDVLDVSNFDTTFTQEEALVSVIPDKQMAKIQNNASQFQNF
jgi:hypothetical protein